MNNNPGSPPRLFRIYSPRLEEITRKKLEREAAKEARKPVVRLREAA